MTPLEELAHAISEASPVLTDAMIRADVDPAGDDELPLFWAMSAARVLAAALPLLPAEESAAVFALVDSAIGDPRTHDVVTAGLVETLASRAPRAGLDDHLGPAALAYVRSLNPG